MKTENEIFELCDQIREAAFALHKYLRNGHLEKVYENGLVNRLRKLEIKVDQQSPLEVRDEDGSLLGEFFADIIAEEELFIELKACKRLAEEHVAQLLGYLRSSGKKHGLLINFGAAKLEIKKYAPSHPS